MRSLTPGASCPVVPWTQPREPRERLQRVRSGIQYPVVATPWGPLAPGDLSRGERANMRIELLPPAQCLVMGGRGPLRPHSAAERSAYTTWKSAVSVHTRRVGRGHRVLRTPWRWVRPRASDCPCSVRVLLPTPADSNQERAGNRREILGSYRCVSVAVTACSRLKRNLRRSAGFPFLPGGYRGRWKESPVTSRGGADFGPRAVDPRQASPRSPGWQRRRERPGARPYPRSDRRGCRSAANLVPPVSPRSSRSARLATG
jgi:hypothetical protein